MKPILFSAPMVNAILDGRKTVTRRVCKIEGVEDYDGVPFVQDQYGDWNPITNYGPYRPGDLLWVRESFRMGHAPNDEPGQGVALYADHRCKYHPDLHPSRYTWCRQWKKRPSIFMPQWASRITLRVTEVGAERLQCITEEDAKAEGVAAWHDTKDGTVYRPEFSALWDKINGKRGHTWESNPWVWIIRFEVVEVSHAG